MKNEAFGIQCRRRWILYSKKEIKHMSYYRLRIEELSNGDNRYYIEKAVLVITKGWIQRQHIEWKDYAGPFSLETTAMTALANIKAEDAKREGQLVVKTTYKDV